MAFDDRNLYGSAVGLDARGRHATAASALEAAFKELTTVRSPFFDSVRAQWRVLFPNLPMHPSKLEDGVLYLGVASAPALYMARPYLRTVRAKLRALPGAPTKLDVRLIVE